ncbi:MAG TPA: M28 family peptidase, partial [Candidatus Methylomirabilis sp.]|nr:M28 family peptidase [Candidatus Methylomirabilis sp.]
TGPVRVNLLTRVFQGWKDIPCLTGDLRPTADGPEAHTFIMLSGHVDSWYYGAMDNGSANATQLEVVRLLAERRSSLRRGLRVAFWSGHSHGRYAGSARYADHRWQDLHDNCAAHVNVDSVGGRGATVLTEGNSMAEMRAFASEVIQAVAGQRLSPRRFGRSGDQSFWGHGIPSLLMTLSEQAPEAADPVLAALFRQISGGHGKSGGLGSWWHTPEDTLDKIDPEFLRRDAIIYTLLTYRLCASTLLPLDYLAVVDELKAVVDDLQTKAGDGFDLSPAAEQLAALGSAVKKLQGRIKALQQGRVSDAAARVVNRCLMELGRTLIPVNYARSGQFDHDLAVPTQPLPGLQPVAKLAAMERASDQRQFLITRLARERNRLVHGVISAVRAVEAALSALEKV